MIKTKRYSIIVEVVIVTLIFIINWATPAQANNGAITTPVVTGMPSLQPDRSKLNQEQEEIDEVIKEYFKLHYQALSISPPTNFQETGFGDLVSDGPDAGDFLVTEMGKLAVERKHYELNELLYVEYKYSLDYRDIILNNSAQQATVSLSVHHHLIRERAAENNPENPRVSTGELIHKIVLGREQGEWKIISDIYWDSMWYTLRHPRDASTDEIMQNIDNKFDQLDASTQTLRSSEADIKYSCGLPIDDTTHNYERSDAVDYAHDHAYNYNLYYPRYDSEALGGDCTNFISQAIYERGNASLSIDLPLHPRDSELTWNKWYLLNGMQRAVAWNDVGAFHDFVTHPYSWNEGPEGCELDEGQLNLLEEGDIIQYERHGDNVWDHSVIVVGEDINGNPLVASHSPDADEEDYDFIDYVSIRGIHIERSDGNPPVKPFIEAIGDDAGTIDCEGGFVGNEVYLGFCEDHEVSVTSGFLFDGIEIPHGATIKYAYITFSVDGPYNNELNLKIHGEATGNSKSFDDEDALPLAVRPITTAATLWEIDEPWNLTDNHNGGESYYSFTTPQLASVIEEIVHQYDWVSGNALSIIIKNDGSTSHRRVIAKERADWDMWPNLFPARLVVAYEGGFPAPTSTPTETPTPTPTPTPTSTPTPTPTPTLTPTFAPSPEPTSTPIWNEAEVVLMKDEPAEKSEAFSALLSQVRDQVLASSSKGDSYIDATYQHALEIMQLFMKNELIRQEFKALALNVQPLLESMIDNRPKSALPHLDKLWIEQTIEILTKIEKQASPELGEEIRWWKERLPGFVGKTGTEIWEILPDRSQ